MVFGWSRAAALDRYFPHYDPLRGVVIGGFGGLLLHLGLGCLEKNVISEGDRGVFLMKELRRGRRMTVE